MSKSQPPTKRQKRTKDPETTPSQESRQLNISKLDLSNLTLDQLAELRDRVSGFIAQKTLPARDNDLLLEYSVKMYSSSGLCSHNEGVFRMNGILHSRVLVDAPSRFEQAFIQQVFTPVNTDLYDVIEGVNPTDNSLKALPHNSEYDAAPGLPTPTIKPPNIIPGE